MRIIIAGGRTFNNYKHMSTVMSSLLSNKPDEPITVVCGMAHGADELGYHWAQQEGHSIDEYPAEWDRYGKSAGFRRNAVMASNADALVAFWDGASKGTKHMIDLGYAAKLKVRVIRY